MNERHAAMILLTVGAILIIGSVRSILAASHRTPENAAITFEAPAQSSTPAAEPIFPGLPAR